jgi:hypothetical protein
MYEEIVSSFLDGQALVIAFNCPVAGFWPLAHILEIDSHRCLAKSEIIFVLAHPSVVEKEMDCGLIISPHLSSVERIKFWSETYLKKSYGDVINNIIKIQELRLDNYQFQKRLLERNYNKNTMKLFASQIYRLQEKIASTNHSLLVLKKSIVQPV